MKQIARLCRFFVLTIALEIPMGGNAWTQLTPAQVLDYTRLADLHFSPDGTKLAYVALSYPQDWKPRLHILDIASGADREITPLKKSERAPRWSQDGKTLAFLSNRNGTAQIYLMSASGGDAAALTARKNAVSAFRWSPDGKTIAYLAKDDSAPSENEGPQIADDERTLNWIWLIDVATRKERHLDTAGYDIESFEWQDASHLMLDATNTPRVEEYTNAIWRLTVTDGAITKIATPPQPFDNLAVSPNGRQFTVRSTSRNGPEPRDLFLATIGQNGLTNLSGALDRSVEQAQWQKGGLWFSVADGFYMRLYKTAQGRHLQEIALPLSISGFDVARNGTVAFVGGDFQHLQDIYLRTPDGKIRQLTHLQAGPVAAQLLPTTIFKTRSFDGQMIEAALVKSSHPPQGKLPLVLLVHGGPSSRFTAGYYWETAWAQLLASHGYQVLMVNPRGSTGYSEDFLKANRGDWGGGDYKDIMAVLDAVIARGETDPNRLGIGGWSYGGEMSIWATTQTHRFKAAVAGAGVFDQAAEFETEDDPAGDEWYFGTPWEHPDLYARNSPATYIARARTPTLILDGEDDASNPVGQSKGLYRALKHLGVETTLVIYQGEGHSPKSGTNNIDMFQRILDWYDAHLK